LDSLNAGEGDTMKDFSGAATNPAGTSQEGDAMIELDLDKGEREILGTVLKSYLSDLRMEIADTDRQEFRDMLKQRKVVIAKVLAALGQPLDTSI
jgi:hypothetical protein